MRALGLMAAGLLLAGAAPARTPALKPGLQGLGFLVGHWSMAAWGEVADTGERSSGELDFTPEVGGSVLLRKDHVRLYDASGMPEGGFDIMMMIYPEAGGIRADDADGTHIIHDVSADIDPGRAATFVSAPSGLSPTFRLSDVLVKSDVVAISFSMAAPGSSDFHSIAAGTVVRDRRARD